LFIIANVSDDGSIDSVVFYVNDVKIGKATSSPYQVSWTASAVGDITIKAIATDNDGMSTTSEIVAVEVVKISDIKTVRSAKSVDVYPNPVQSTLYIDFVSFKGGEEITISIFDITGNTVLRKTLTAQTGKQLEQVDLSYLYNGIYILKINTSDNYFSHNRIIKK
jgi:hypothetical protein